MANYIVGDIQGCFEALTRALDLVDFQWGKDTLWLTGDLVARGPQSLETLEFLYQHQDAVRIVLGNHDLHFLAVANGLKSASPGDQLDALLASKNLNTYCDWIRSQPLVQSLPNQDGYMSHAGLPPLWSAEKAMKRSASVQKLLSGKDWKKWLPKMYGNKPDVWQKGLSDDDKFRFTITGLTRMRFCYPDGRLDFECKTDVKAAPKGLQPWFDIDPERFQSTKWVFGHWAALMGHTGKPNIIGLDTGFVWGKHLTIYQYENQERHYVRAKVDAKTVNR